jgi:hypothetical protein
MPVRSLAPNSTDLLSTFEVGRFPSVFKKGCQVHGIAGSRLLGKIGSCPYLTTFNLRSVLY